MRSNKPLAPFSSKVEICSKPYMPSLKLSFKIIPLFYYSKEGLIHIGAPELPVCTCRPEHIVHLTQSLCEPLEPWWQISWAGRHCTVLCHFKTKVKPTDIHLRLCERKPKAPWYGHLGLFFQHSQVQKVVSDLCSRIMTQLSVLWEMGFPWHCCGAAARDGTTDWTVRCVSISESHGT